MHYKANSLVPFCNCQNDLQFVQYTNWLPKSRSSNTVYLITCRRCGQQYVGETGQHHRINSHRFDAKQRWTEESPAVEHFNGERHACGHDCHGDRSTTQPWLLSSQNMGKQVDQNPGDLTSFQNEPQGGFFVKLARKQPVDPVEFYKPDWHQGYWLSQKHWV